MKKLVNIIMSFVFLLAVFAVSGCAKLDDKNIVLKPVEWTNSAKILGLKLTSDNFGVLVTNNGDATVQVNFKADCYDKGDFWKNPRLLKSRGSSILLLVAIFKQSSDLDISSALSMP